MPELGSRAGLVHTLKLRTLVFTMTMSLACGAGVTGAVPSPVAGVVTFKVVAAASGEPLGKVAVAAATAEGIKQIGETSSTGVVVASTEELREIEPYAILFCHRDFFCGAIVENATPKLTTKSTTLAWRLFLSTDAVKFL